MAKVRTTQRQEPGKRRGLLARLFIVGYTALILVFVSVSAVVLYQIAGWQVLVVFALIFAVTGIMYVWAGGRVAVPRRLAKEEEPKPKEAQAESEPIHPKLVIELPEHSGDEPRWRVDYERDEPMHRRLYRYRSLVRPIALFASAAVVIPIVAWIVGEESFRSRWVWLLVILFLILTSLPSLFLLWFFKISDRSLDLPPPFLGYRTDHWNLEVEVRGPEGPDALQEGEESQSGA
jgi:hypothetical protein